MTEPDDPARLLEASSSPAGLREALRAARADSGSEAQVARLAQRLGPLLGPVGAAAPVTAASKLALSKLGLAAAALVVAGGGAWLLSTPTVAPARSPASPTNVNPSAQARPLTARPIALPAAEPAPPSAAPTPGDAATSPKVPDKPSPPAQPSEAELLEQARSALKSDPARALQRASEHAARFPRGVLVQEREVLAIQALRQLGRDVEADRRTAAFAKAFPGSAFQRKLSAPR